MNEYLLSVDKFQKPKILRDKEAIYTLLVRLLVMTPGTIQSHPEMGIGIVTRYRYMDMDKVHELSTDIQRQVAKYLPQFQSVEVELETVPINKELIIKISIDGTLYALKTDSVNNTVTLADL